MKNEKAKVRIIPLGGINEIGKNITVIEYKEDIFALKVGVDEDGDDLLIPIDDEVELAAVQEAYDTIFSDEE